ncbi:response regulator [Pedobacter chitinilyticus]|uniref:Response regulator n=1 Tax=Pedobacter chitinilyticus TaxID=2233776 RepID=A0A443YUF4_9SPHI|nr:response regulator [Pedobacter chitinilyticus]RWU07500.1 response regulator [Pedobacter chitinilyticus]
MTTMYNPLILIAEDDPDDALMLKDAFSEINQPTVTFLNNGKLLIEHIQQLLLTNKLPNLIVIDLNMPVLDGRGVIKELQKNTETKNIPLVVLSTTKSKEDIDSVMALGASEFFTKPASFSDLVGITNTIATKWLNT